MSGVEGPARLELATRGLKGRCSTNWAMGPRYSTAKNRGYYLLNTYESQSTNGVSFCRRDDQELARRATK